ncbi:HD domain-containing protein [Photorhabdus namnaonensis]|uniref:HD domain protein n=1 Tax=Photorhabdus namnaonensis TaxID=1851568 RepID=A0A1B8YJE0_9GAMM|nr:HD domain-containing protein [Photorhabdus namnaonensis]OCA55197.1 HD domain protein [Photorhabdus namnaonensis]
MSFSVNGVSIPDTQITRDATTFIRDTESDLLFHHSSRVYYWGALAGQRLGLSVDHELLYVGCMFHDIGLTHEHCSCDKRFEVDGANAAKHFLQGYGIAQADIDKVWTAIALHTTPGIPEFMAPEIALVTAGVEMDVLGINYEAFSDSERIAVVQQHPRTDGFKEDIIQAFYDGIKDRSQTMFGSFNVDVIQDKKPGLVPLNYCDVIRNSRWKG